MTTTSPASVSPAAPAAPAVGQTAAQPDARPVKRRNFLARIPAAWAFAFLITVILVVGEATAGILGGYTRLPLALGTAIFFEVLLSKGLRNRWPHPLSSYITGNSVAILVKPAGGLFWPIAAVSAISIVCKYCLVFRGRHLWNPSNFGIAALLLVAPGSMAILSHEWGNELESFLIVFAVGLFVAARGGLLHLSLTYALAFVALAKLRSLLVGGDAFIIEVAAMTGPLYLLFIFFMITDPRTIVRGKRNQVLVVLIIALVDCTIRVLGNNDVGWIQPLLPAPPIFALAIVGPLALVVEALRTPKPPEKALKPAPMAATPAAG